MTKKLANLLSVQGIRKIGWSSFCNFPHSRSSSFMLAVALLYCELLVSALILRSPKEKVTLFRRKGKVYSEMLLGE